MRIFFNYLFNLSIFNKMFYSVVLIIILVISISSTTSYLYSRSIYLEDATHTAARLADNINTGFEDILIQVDRIILSIYADAAKVEANKKSVLQVIASEPYVSLNEEYEALKATRDFFQRLLRRYEGLENKHHVNTGN